jgi:hypothetical protein
MRLMQWTHIVRECRGSGMKVKGPGVLKTMLMKNGSIIGSIVLGKKHLESVKLSFNIPCLLFYSQYL